MEIERERRTASEHLGQSGMGGREKICSLAVGRSKEDLEVVLKNL